MHSGKSPANETHALDIGLPGRWGASRLIVDVAKESTSGAEDIPDGILLRAKEVIGLNAGSVSGYFCSMNLDLDEVPGGRCRE